MKDFLEPYLRRSPTSTTLRVGTNNSINHSSSAILNNFLSLKYFNTVHLSMTAIKTYVETLHVKF